MDIDKFSGACCDFCHDKDDICISCKKIILYEAIKDGIFEASHSLNFHDIFEKLNDKIEFVAESIGELTTEIYKYRQDNLISVQKSVD